MPPSSFKASLIACQNARCWAHKSLVGQDLVSGLPHHTVMGREAAGRQKHMEAAKVTVDEKTKVVTKWVHNKRVEVSKSWCGVCLFCFLFVSLGSVKIGSSSLLPRSSSSNNDTLFDLALILLFLLGSAADHRPHTPNTNHFQYPRFHPRFEGVIQTWSHTFPLDETSLSVSGSRLRSVTNTLGAGACQQESRITLGKSYSSKMSEI